MDWLVLSLHLISYYLEGIEAVFIVLTFGLAVHSLISAITGSIIGLVLIVLAGVLLRKPLATIPENTLKFVVGLMLSGFGIFWVGEGINVNWWHAHISILVITLSLLLVPFICVRVLSRKHNQQKSRNSSKKALGEQI